MEALQHVSMLMNIKDPSSYYTLGDAESELLRHGIISNEDAGREIPQLPNMGNQVPQSPFTPRELQLEFSRWIGLGYMEALQHVSMLMNIKDPSSYYTLGDAESELLRHGIISNEDAGRDVPNLPSEDINRNDIVPSSLDTHSEMSLFTPSELRAEFLRYSNMSYVDALRHVSLAMSTKDTSNYYTLGETERELLLSGVISSENVQQLLPYPSSGDDQNEESPFTPREWQLEFLRYGNMEYVEALEQVSRTMSSKDPDNDYTVADAERKLLRYGVISR